MKKSWLSTLLILFFSLSPARASERLLVLSYDVYVGEDLPDGKKSITFSVVMQNPNKTLEESELERACSGIVTLAESVEGVSIRG